MNLLSLINILLVLTSSPAGDSAFKKMNAVGNPADMHAFSKASKPEEKDVRLLDIKIDAGLFYINRLRLLRDDPNGASTALRPIKEMGCEYINLGYCLRSQLRLSQLVRVGLDVSYMSFTGNEYLENPFVYDGDALPFNTNAKTMINLSEVSISQKCGPSSEKEFDPDNTWGTVLLVYGARHLIADISMDFIGTKIKDRIECSCPYIGVLYKTAFSTRLGLWLQYQCGWVGYHSGYLRLNRHENVRLVSCYAEIDVKLQFKLTDNVLAFAGIRAVYSHYSLRRNDHDKELTYDFGGIVLGLEMQI